jgi:predicted metal-dependent phosphotriesterase family hydrolase
MRQSILAGKVQAVLGEIDAKVLGITSCHEHILFDMSVRRFLAFVKTKS